MSDRLISDRQVTIANVDQRLRQCQVTYRQHTYRQHTYRQHMPRER